MDDSIELRQLRCLVVLAEELNYRRAAERLHVSQPPLTRLVAETERRLGARLFERTTRRVSLTPIGEIFVAEAQAVLARSEMATETIQAAIRRAVGQIRIVYSPLSFLTVLPGILSGLRGSYHDIRIDLLEMRSAAQLEALLLGHADLAFTDEAPHEPTLHRACLHREPLSVLLPENHALAVLDSVTLAALAGETFVLHPRSDYPAYYDRVLAACQAAGFVPRVSHREAQQNCAVLVAAGNGILLTPATFGRNPTPGMCYVPLESAESEGLQAEVWAAWPRVDA
ncbi:MAG: LysR family transcriptional regulator, partial [Cytophagales bacterium]|nr:LysR family transcriptional regulator [Armatimonadota bacterium]